MGRRSSNMGSRGGTFATTSSVSSLYYFFHFSFIPDFLLKPEAFEKVANRSDAAERSPPSSKKYEQS